MKTRTVQSITIKDQAYANSNLMRTLEVEGPFVTFNIQRLADVEHIALKVLSSGYVGIWTSFNPDYFNVLSRSNRKTIKAELKHWEKVQRHWFEASLDELVDVPTEELI